MHISLVIFVIFVIFLTKNTGSVATAVHRKCGTRFFVRKLGISKIQTQHGKEKTLRLFSKIASILRMLRP